MTSDGVVAASTSHATDHTGLVVGYVVGGLIMCLGGVVEILFGVKAGEVAGDSDQAAGSRRELIH